MGSGNCYAPSVHGDIVYCKDCCSINFDCSNRCGGNVACRCNHHGTETSLAAQEESKKYDYSALHGVAHSGNCYAPSVRGDIVYCKDCCFINFDCSNRCGGNVACRCTHHGTETSLAAQEESKKDNYSVLHGIAHSGNCYAPSVHGDIVTVKIAALSISIAATGAEETSLAAA